jgi:hypothetical protein
MKGGIGRRMLSPWIRCRVYKRHGGAVYKRSAQRRDLWAFLARERGQASKKWVFPRRNRCVQAEKSLRHKGFSCRGTPRQSAGTNPPGWDSAWNLVYPPNACLIGF